MTVAAFRLLFLRPLVHRPARTLIAVAGVAGGAALAVAVLTIRSSVAESVEGFQNTGDADLVVTASSPGGLHAAALETITTDGDVVLAAPILRRTVAIDRAPIPFVGIDDRALAFGAEELHAAQDATVEAPDAGPSTLGAGMVLGARAADQLDIGPGDPVEVFATQGPSNTVQVTGIVDGAAIQDVNGGVVAFASLDLARSLTGGFADLVLVNLADSAGAGPFRERLAAAHPHLQVDSPQAFLDRETGLFTIAQNQLLPIAAVSLVVAAVLVFNAVNMTVLERRRQLANLRALGATHRHLLLGVIGQAGVLGLLGGIVGSLAGLAISRPVIDTMAPALADVLGTDIAHHPAPGALPFAIIGATLAGIGAGIIPARRIATVEPTDALRPGGTPAQGGTASRWQPTPTIAGSTLSILSLAGLVLGPTETATSATAGIALGVILTTYGLAGPIAILTAALLRRLGGLPSIAAAGIARNPQRLWATTTALAMGVALAIAVGGGAANQRSFTSDQFDSLRNTDLWVGATSVDDLTYDLRLPSETEATIAAIPGVATTATDTLTHLTIDGHRIIAAGLTGPSAFPLLAATDPDIAEQAIAGEGAVISHQYAKTFALDTGDTMALPGVPSIPVLDVVETLALAEHGMIAIADNLLRTTAPAVEGINSIEVLLEPGASPHDVGQRIETVLAGAAHPLQIQTGHDAHRTAMTTLDQLYAATDGMLTVVVLIGGLAVLNTVLASVLERRRELGILRAIGSSPAQTTRIITIEIAAIATIGLTTGLLLGELLHWAGTTYAAAATPLPVDYLPAPTATLTALLAGTVAVAVGALIPIRATHRIEILDAIAWE